MRDRICDNAFDEIKQFVMEKYDEIFPFAITEVEEFQIRIPLDLWELLPDQEKEALEQNATRRSVPNGSTGKYVYTYKPPRSYVVHTKITEVYEILAEERIYFIDRREINATQEKWINENWTRNQRFVR